MGSIDSGIRDVRAGRLASDAYSDVFSDLHPRLLSNRTAATSVTMRHA